MKSQWRLIWGFVMVFIVVVFSVINTTVVDVNFGFISIESPLIYIILGSTIIGALIVLVVLFTNFWKQRRELKELRKQILIFETENNQIIEAQIYEEREQFQREIDKKTQRIAELEQLIIEQPIQSVIEATGHEDELE